MLSCPTAWQSISDPGRGRSCGVEVGHQPGRVGGEQKTRVFEQVVQLADLAAPTPLGQLPSRVAGEACFVGE